MRFSALSLIPLAGLAAALQVTQPGKNDEFKTSDSITVKWSSVNTDASSFNIYLVNNAVYPPVNKEIATNVKTSDNSYTIKDLSGLSAGSGYQVNLESDSTQNTGILAQSQQFNMTGSAQSSSSSSSSSSSASSTETSSSSATSESASMTTMTTTGEYTSGSMTMTTTGTSTGTVSAGTATGTSTGTKASGSANASGTSSTAIPTGNAGVAVRPAAAFGLVAGALALAL